MRMLEALLDWQFEALPPAFLNPAAVQIARDRVAGHGDSLNWSRALESLPDCEVIGHSLGDRVSIALRNAPVESLREALVQLNPWRKGPFAFGELCIDAEWRSNLKWQRLSPLYPSLKDALVLDVGSGNGYYGWRMLEAGARRVLGVDRNPLCLAQHLAVQRYARDRRNLLLPLELRELPETWSDFDLVFSMGVLSHTREPGAHLRALFERIRPGGLAVVESLVLGEGGGELRPADRYARMRNVWRLPGARCLRAWLQESGFTEVELICLARTTTLEQRTTEWMPFESLCEALDKHDGSRTVEGLPAPCRALVSARRP